MFFSFQIAVLRRQILELQQQKTAENTTGAASTKLVSNIIACIVVKSFQRPKNVNTVAIDDRLINLFFRNSKKTIFIQRDIKLTILLTRVMVY